MALRNSLGSRVVVPVGWVLVGDGIVDVRWGLGSAENSAATTFDFLVGFLDLLGFEQFCEKWLLDFFHDVNNYWVK